MNQQHTPAPWQVHSHMGEHIVTGGNPSFLVAHVSNGRTHHEQDEANAHLIAAAPGLLELAQTIVRLADGRQWSGNLILDENSPLMGAARDLVAQATGAAA